MNRIFLLKPVKIILLMNNYLNNLKKLILLLAKLHVYMYNYVKLLHNSEQSVNNVNVF